MEEAGSGDVSHRRSHLLSSMNHIHSERVNRISIQEHYHYHILYFLYWQSNRMFFLPANVISIDSRDEHFALVIVDKQSTNHTGISSLK